MLPGYLKELSLIGRVPRFYSLALVRVVLSEK
jgi:hypothetical protein